VALNTRPSGVINVPVDKQRWYGFVQSLLSDRIVQHSDRSSEQDLALAPVEDTARSGKATASMPAADNILVKGLAIIRHSFGSTVLSVLVSAGLFA
jgi:hypothetical protein